MRHLIAFFFLLPGISFAAQNVKCIMYEPNASLQEGIEVTADLEKTNYLFLRGKEYKALVDIGKITTVEVREHGMSDQEIPIHMSSHTSDSFDGLYTSIRTQRETKFGRGDSKALTIACSNEK